jgi:hypothetical protein
MDALVDRSGGDRPAHRTDVAVVCEPDLRDPEQAAKEQGSPGDDRQNPVASAPALNFVVRLEGRFVHAVMFATGGGPHLCPQQDLHII